MIRLVSAILVLLLYSCSFLSPVQAYSEGWDWGKGETGGFSSGKMIWPVDAPPAVMTSAYGMRVHPIFGGHRFHSGVDLADDAGTPIKAAAGGSISYAGWISGYGNTVIIDHGSGVSTLYGHNQLLNVSEGAAVSQGSIIAFMGSTGNSTGPHCHFEVRVNDVPQDPGLYVPGMEQMEVDLFGTLADGSGKAVDFNGMNSSFEVTQDFAKPIKEVIDKFTDLITKALKLIESYVYQIFLALMTMDLAIAAMYKGLGAWGNEDNETFVNWFLYKIVFYMIMVFLLTHWNSFVLDLALEGFPQLGAMSVGSTMEDAGKVVSNPADIVQKGMSIIAPVINEALTIKNIWDVFSEGETAFICLAFGLTMFGCFLLIGIQIAKAYLYFYFVVLFAFVNFMLSGLKWTRKYAANGINGIFAASLNLTFFIIFSLILQGTMSSIVVGQLVETKTVESAVGAGAKIISLEDCLQRMKAVESYGGNYHCDNGQGYYGAYQIDYGNYNNWDHWCADYERSGGHLIHDGEGYERFPGPTGPQDTAPEPTSTSYPWPPSNQDAVAAFIVQGYYNKYGSWEAACRAWNQGEGGMENAEAYKYQQMILSKKGADKTTRAANLGLLFKLLLVCLLFIYFADHMQKLIDKQFGGMGFKLTNE